MAAYEIYLSLLILSFDFTFGQMLSNGADILLLNKKIELENDCDYSFIMIIEHENKTQFGENQCDIYV